MLYYHVTDKTHHYRLYIFLVEKATNSHIYGNLVYQNLI